MQFRKENSNNKGFKKGLGLKKGYKNWNFLFLLFKKFIRLWYK